MNRIPGHVAKSGGRQPKHVGALARCMADQRICLLHEDGQVVGGASEAEVGAATATVVFAFVRDLRAGGQSYCVTAGLDRDAGSDARAWSYRTIGKDGDWVGAQLYESTTQPKTSTEVFNLLARGFEYFQKEPSARRRARPRAKETPECGWTVAL